MSFFCFAQRVFMPVILHAVANAAGIVKKKFFIQFMIKTQSLNTRIPPRCLKFFFNRPITHLQREHKAATNRTSASKREATGYHTPQSFNALSAAIRATVNRLRHSVRAWLLSFRRRDATQHAIFTRTSREAEACIVLSRDQRGDTR